MSIENQFKRPAGWRVRNFFSSPPFWPFLVLAFLGSMIWAHSRDPFRRLQFATAGPNAQKIQGIAVLPRHAGRIISADRGGSRLLPLVIYVHGVGDTWIGDGDILRQFAELGIASVGFDYSQTNGDAFTDAFTTVLDYVRRQNWVNTNAIAWVGFGAGADYTLKYLLNHPTKAPRVYVRVDGNPSEVTANSQALPVDFPSLAAVLFVNDEHEKVLHREDADRLPELFRSVGASVNVIQRPRPDVGLYGGVLFRLIGEYCKSRLTPAKPLPEFPQVQSYTFVYCIVPALGWFAFWFYQHGKTRFSIPKRPQSKSEVGLCVVAIVVLISAIAESALHLIPLQSKITPQTLEFARGHLIPPEWKNDFETLAALPIWREQPLRTLFGHLELAHYTTYQLENWKVDEETYHHYVLSPAITGDDRELNWRRSLWDNFYPRVRHESSLQNAASIVGQFLRQRVTIASDYPGAPGIESAWNVRVANPSDFECLYVAALRSVGIPARLNASRHTEYWTGQTWESAPRPDDLQ